MVGKECSQEPDTAEGDADREPDQEPDVASEAGNAANPTTKFGEFDWQGTMRDS